MERDHLNKQQMEAMGIKQGATLEKKGCFKMAYSQTENKDIFDLHDELCIVYHEYYCTEMPFMKMIELFANDDFYKLHLVAKKYIEII